VPGLRRRHARFIGHRLGLPGLRLTLRAFTLRSRLIGRHQTSLSCISGNDESRGTRSSRISNNERQTSSLM